MTVFIPHRRIRLPPSAGAWELREFFMGNGGRFSGPFTGLRLNILDRKEPGYDNNTFFHGIPAMAGERIRTPQPGDCPWNLVPAASS
jgi:hypothetical protein